MNISLCLTTYNRTDLLFRSFADLVDDERVSEIIIVDDHSDEKVYEEIKAHCKEIKKVGLFRNSHNLDCYRNKRQAVKKATSDWVIIGDSDNIFTRRYVDRLEDVWIGGPKHDVIYQPEFARPHFDFTPYAGVTVNRNNVASYMGDATFQTALNAMNYFVNREEYLRVWDGTVDPVTSDSIFQNYNWLKAGGSIYFVPGLQYEHTVHEGSHYQQNVKRTPQGFHNSIVDKIKSL